MEKHIGPTPNGGDCSFGYFCDDDWNEVPQELATWLIITEYKNDGTLVMEIFGKTNKKAEKERKPDQSLVSLFEQRYGSQKDKKPEQE